MSEHSIPVADEFPFHWMVNGPAGTAALGEKLSGLLQGGEIILLHGSLGAGKTCFTQGLCRGLAVRQDVVSPTFTLVNSYQGRLDVHHLDFYRIEPDADLMDIGVPEILDQADDGLAVVVVEWPDLFLAALGEDQPRLELLATGGEGPDDRIWHLRGTPSVPPEWARMFDCGNDGPTAKEPEC